MSLFQTGNFNLNSGESSTWKVECDALTDEDLRTLAYIATTNVLFKIGISYGTVEGVPTGGLRFAKELEKYATGQHLLIADDVLTTGNSMERLRNGREAIGIVIFARAKPPPWIHAIWSLY